MNASLTTVRRPTAIALGTTHQPIYGYFRHLQTSPVTPPVPSVR